MRRQDELLTSRARVTPRYALVPLEGVPAIIVYSSISGFTGKYAALIADALGADLRRLKDIGPRDIRDRDCIVYELVPKLLMDRPIGVKRDPDAPGGRRGDPSGRINNFGTST